MLNHSQAVIFNNKKYILRFDDISTFKSVTIDEKSYVNGSFNTLKEMRELLLNINFTIECEDKVIFDSKVNEVDNIDFKFCDIIYKSIKPHLNLSQIEKDEFYEKCDNFLETKVGSMPYELLLANQMINNNLCLTLSEVENMNIKKFEKLQIAISKIKMHVLDKTSEN